MSNRLRVIVSFLIYLRLKTGNLNYKLLLCCLHNTYFQFINCCLLHGRHNGNVMIDSIGHLIHIDFGFVFGLAPGKQLSMEKAPFKLTEELAAVMGGPGSPEFEEYISLCTRAFVVARKHAHAVSRMMEIMAHRSQYPSFRYNSNAILDFRRRLFLDQKDADVDKIVRKLVMQ